MQEFERARNRMPLIDHQIIAAAPAAGPGAPSCVKGSMRRVLMSVLSLSKGEAARRVRARRRRSGRGRRCWANPWEPALAAAGGGATCNGEVSAEKVAIIERALDEVDRGGLDPADLAAGEALLTGHAAVFPPEDLRLLADRVVDGIDRTAPCPRRVEHRSAVPPSAVDPGRGLCRGLPAHRHPRRQTQTPAGPAGQTADPRVGEVDGRSYGQRLHDALEICVIGNSGPAMCRRPGVSRPR